MSEIPFMPFTPDPYFFATSKPLSVTDAAALGQAEIIYATPDQGQVSHIAPLVRAGLGSAAFAEKTVALGLATQADPAIVFVRSVDADAARTAFPRANIAVCKLPKAAFAAIGRALHESLYTKALSCTGIAAEAEIAKSATIAPNAVIMAGARIAKDVVIGPFCVIGPGVEIGAATTIASHCAISHAIIGQHCFISSGVRIGEAGFGYVPGATGADSIPQIGRVRIADGVDLGANTTVDRGALADTVIGAGTKIDNQCQIGHNCQVGQHVLVAAQTGVSGSCIIGDGVMIGGQVGMAEHLTIGAGAVITARSGLMRDVPAGEKWGGAPAKPAREWMKEIAMISRMTKKDKKRG